MLSPGKRPHKECLSHIAFRRQKTHIGIVNTLLSTQVNKYPAPDASGHAELPTDCSLRLVLCKAFIINIDPARFYVAPRPLQTPGVMDRVNTVSNTDPRRAPELIPRPTFGLWDAIFFLNQDATSLIEADEVVFGH